MLNKSPRGSALSDSSAAHPPRAQDARTLYLAAADPLRVTSTGEALVVSRPDGQAQRLPISRVLRIVCAASVDWSGAALSLCMQRGVTVSWLDACGGHAQGHLWPARTRSTDLADALHALCTDEPTWPLAYDHWLRHQRMRILTQWAAERTRAGQPVRDAEWQVAKQGWVYQNSVPEHLPPLLRGMAAAQVSANLSECGLPSHFWCVDDKAIELAHDITHLIWGEMNLCSGGLADAINHPQEAAALFEHWSRSRAGAIFGHLASLRVHALRELAC